MPYASLRDFMERLEAQGQLVRVAAPVSPALEMTEIQTRLIAERGPAVLFENAVREDGTPFDVPVLANLFGTVERVAWAMGREVDGLRALGEMLAFLDHPEPPQGLRQAVGMLPLVKTALSLKPKLVSRAPCQEVVLQGSDIDLAALPVQTCWPGEPAPLITWPLVVTKGPDEARTDNFNLGIYRMQVTGRNTTLIRWLRHRGGAQHHARWAAAHAEPLPVAAVIGAERFLKEIEVTANLQHPNILPLYDSGVADSFLYYVMPYIEGESLREKMDREGALPIPEAARILREVADALA